MPGAIAVRALPRAGDGHGARAVVRERALDDRPGSEGALAMVFGGFPALQALRHPNLAPYLDLYEIKGRVLVLSYHTSSTLASLLRGTHAAVHEWGDALCSSHELDTAGGPRRLSNAAASLVCLHVAKAAEYLHDQGLVHGRITPDCILLTDRTTRGEEKVLLGDYGTQLLTGGIEGFELVPSLEFCAPEVIASYLLKPTTGFSQDGCAATANGRVGGLQPAADLWSIGAVLLYALSASSRRLPWSPPPVPDESSSVERYEASAAGVCSGILAFAGLPLPNVRW